MHATAHAVIIDRHYIGPLNSLYSFHSRSKTIVELIVAVEILEVFEENDPQEVKISKKNTAVVCVTAVLALKEDGVAEYDRVSSETTFFSTARPQCEKRCKPTLLLYCPVAYLTRTYLLR